MLPKRDDDEATRVVFSRIVGLLLIQGHGKKEMIRLAFGLEALLHLVISQGKEGARSSH